MIEYFKAKPTFDRVFGADSFIEYWPEILTTGIRLMKGSDVYGWYHVVDEQGKKFNDTAFFSAEEMEHLEKVDDPS